MFQNEPAGALIETIGSLRPLWGESGHWLIERHHQFADRFAVAQSSDRLAAVLERIGRADLRRDLAFPPPAEQLFDMRRVALGVARDEPAPEHTAHVAALQQRQVERQPGDA